MTIRNQKPQTLNQTVRLGLIQHACGPDPQKNFVHAIAMIRQAARRGAQIIVTQELFLTRYFCQAEDEKYFRLAEPIPGPTSQKLTDLSRKLRVTISASLFEKRAPGIYHNTSIVIDPSKGIVGRYRKMHIPDDPRFYEKYYFTPGDLGWQVHQTRHARLGTLICWDQWYPEAARLTSLQGADVLLYPTAIGWYKKEKTADRKQQQDAWTTIQRSHAIANGVFVAAVNRVGTENDLEFWGSSFVADPGGAIIAQASESNEQVLIADCDLSRIQTIRHGWPFLRDRRIDAYSDITKRFLKP